MGASDRVTARKKMKMYVWTNLTMGDMVNAIVFHSKTVLKIDGIR